MTSSRSVQKELESLRDEIAGLRQDYERLRKRANATKADASDRAGAIGAELANTIEAIKESLSETTGTAADEISAQLNQLRQTVNEYSEKTEKTITAHPIATLAGAVLVGYVIGRFGR